MIGAAVVVVLAVAGVGLLALVMAMVLTASMQRSRHRLNCVLAELERTEHHVRTPEQRAELARRVAEMEAQQRVIFGIFDHGGP
jgi:type VI protein secretion system component VasK